MNDRDTIEKALAAAGGRMDAAAKALNVSRRTLQNRMRSLGMSRVKAGRPKHPLGGRRARRWGTVATVAVVGTAALAFVATKGSGGA